MSDENSVLLRRLDEWAPDKNPGPVIRWAAAHLRGCIAAETDPLCAHCHKRVIGGHEYKADATTTCHISCHDGRL